ncbi:MAG: ABC transporter permease, partial [Saprospiraceae bacterium]|nr:ABC transporter permease [Saprospiraceae bacterium]
MFKNYLVIAWRNLRKNTTATLINIIGLTTGLTCCLLMVLYMQHELSYDKFITNHDRIVRLIMEYSFNDEKLNKGNYTSTKVFPAFKKSFPEVEDGVRMADYSRIVKYGDKIFNEENFYFADSSFFKMFSFRLLKGNASSVLESPRQVVLTETTARKYFGTEDPVGKTILVSSTQEPYVITGVAEDCPSNSQIKFNFLASFSSLGQTQEETYFNANFTTYLLLRDKASIAGLQKKIKPFMANEVKTGYDPGTYINFELEPYSRVHLYSAYDGFEANSNITYIYIIAAIALLILMIACFTYINLSTAQSLQRAREVGIRKVSGAYHGQVFWQFIGESVLITLVVALLSLGLAAFALPEFNKLSDKSLMVSQLFQPSILIAVSIMVTVISLMAGSYPALVLSRFEPVKVLKGAFKNTQSGNWLRQSLIVFQFSIAVFLIVATFIIQQQLQYIQNKKLGYDRSHILVLNIDQRIVDKIDLVKTEFKTNREVLGVSKAHSTPVNIVGGYSMSKSDQETEGIISVKASPIDEDYLKVNNLELVTGSDLSRQDILDANQTDETNVYYHYILNESGAKALGWKPEEAIGKKMFLGSHRPGEVKGVVKDFHFASLHNPIEPLVLFPGGWGSTLLVKLSGNNLSQTIADIGQKWQLLAPHRPFEYRFLDEDFGKMYISETRTGRVFSIFSFIAILLACLGLFGLSAYAAHQRVKEIGVRKVLGASVGNIVVLLSNNFIKLI